MRKISFSILGLVMGVAMFTACDKEETASPLTFDDSVTASIKGYLFADLDLTKQGLEPATGQKVYAYITYSSIKINNSSSSLSSSTIVWSDTVTVAADGSYVVNYPVGLTASTVNIVPMAFNYNQVQPFNSVAQTIEKVFTVSGVTSVSTTAGATVPQLTYNGVALDGFKQLTKISGKMLADMNQTITGLEAIPTNITVKFFTEGANGKSWSASYVTSNASGVYTDLNIPANEAVFISYEFETLVTVGGGTSETWVFKSNKQSVGTFGTSASTDINIVFNGSKKN
jgi:hypothetical protein